MKKPLFSVRLLLPVMLPALALFISVSACKKSSSPISPSNAASATIGTVSFQSTVTSGIDYSGTLQLTAMQIVKGDTTVLMLNFPDTLVLNKSYVLDGTIVSLDYYDTKSGSTTYTATGQGTDASSFILTGWNKTSKVATGTFGCKVWPPNGDGIIVSSGKFNISYQ
jgi:hypothetical protein